MLVTLEQAKLHLRIDDTDEGDARCQLKLEQAQQIVLDYLKEAWVDPTWTDLTIPEHIHAAILAVLEVLYDGDPEDDPITPGVESLLRRSRDPAMA
jgi:hypothetical protein